MAAGIDRNRVFASGTVYLFDFTNLTKMLTSKHLLLHFSAVPWFRDSNEVS